MPTTSRQRAGLIALTLLLGVAASAAMASELVVSNVQVEQRAFTAIWDVTYNLQTIDGLPVRIWLSLSTDGGQTFPLICQTVSGDVGPGVMPGTGLQIEWDAGADYPDLVESNCRLRVLADDGVPPPGFVYIPPGTFTMGSPDSEPQRYTTEGPQHQVTLTKGFYMSQYEVTEEWWAEVMSETPTTSQLPKSYVTWYMAVEFCNALSIQEGLTPAYEIPYPVSYDVIWNQNANGYRLPTEAEWEYACRATTTLAFNNNTNCLSSDTEANYAGEYPLTGCLAGVYRDAPTAVGSFPANPWDLYDMHGNMWEWVWCGMRTYTSNPQVDPVTSPDPGASWVIRGGTWCDFARDCRSAGRYGRSPLSAAVNLGFRPVRSAP